MSILAEIKAIQSSPKELRKFGVTFAVVCAVVTGFLLYKNHPAAMYYLGAGVAFLFLALLLPLALKPLQICWMALAVVMGWVMTRVILSILFFIVITSMRCIGMVFRYRFLELKADPSATTYWIPRKSQPPRTVENYERQF